MIAKSLTEIQGETLATIMENSDAVRALEIVVGDHLKSEVSRMRNAVASGNMHEATLCEGRMQAMSDFVGDLKKVANDYRKIKKGPLRDSL